MTARLLIVAALTAVCVAMPAAAQSFPSRPVRIIVPYAPGGAVDTAIAKAKPVARFVRAETQKYGKLVKAAGIQKQ